MSAARRRLVPEVIQSSATDCGPACLAALLRGSLERSGDLPPDFDDVAAHLRYVGGFFSADEPGELPAVLGEVREELRAAGGSDPLVVFFLAVPPAAFPAITEGLGRHGLADGSRVVFE